MNPLAIFNRSTALGISLTYLVAAGLWIFFSDSALLWAVDDPAIVARLQSIKGFAFVLITAIFLYWLVQNRLPTVHAEIPPRTSRQRLALAALTVAIGIAGLVFFSALRSAVRYDVHDNLQAIAELKRQHIQYWLDERRTDAVFTASEWQSDPAFLDWLASNDNEIGLSRVRQKLQNHLRIHGYSTITIYDTAARVRFSEGEPEDTGSWHSDIANTAMRTRTVQLVDFHMHTRPGKPVVGFIAPLLSNGRALGAMYFSTNPDTALFDMVEQWPTHSRTAESILLRRENDQFRFLSRLRHRNIPPMSYTASIANSELSAVAAALSPMGLIEGRHDYRGQKVLTYASAIKGTPWLLISKIDEREAYDEIYEIAFGTVLAMLATILMVVALLRNHWRSQALSTRLNLLQSEYQRESLEQQLDLLSRFANDIIIMTTLDGRPVSVNERALEIYGYTREEVPHLRGEDLRARDTRDTYHELLDNIQRLKSMRYETVHQRKDGTTFPVEVNARLIDVGDQTYIHIIMHDISERKAAEASILRLNRLYAAINQANQAIARCTDEGRLFSLVCRHIVELGGMKLAWVGLTDTDKMVKSVASFGTGEEYLDDINISISADSPYGHGPTGTAIREDRPYWCQDFQHDVATSLWHRESSLYGWRGSASLPIHRNGGVIGSINMYSAETNAFDEAARNLLEQLATDVSLALDRFDANYHRAALQAELERARTRLSHILDVNPALIYTLTAHPHQDGAFVTNFISGQIQMISGYSIDQWLSAQDFWFQHVHPDDRDSALKAQENLMAHGAARHQYRFLHGDGKYRWIDDQLILERDSSGKPVEIIGAWLDITDIKQAEDQLRLNAQVFDYSSEGIVITDAYNNILSVNRAFTRITGYSEEEVRGKNPRILASSHQDGPFYDTMWQKLIATGTWSGEILNRRKNGEIYPEWISISTVKDAEGRITHHIGVMADITEYKAAQEKIHHLAHYDPLTKLPNRTLLQDRVQTALSIAQRESQHAALLFLDVDRFKSVNDTLGHQVGDELLIQVAQRLTGLLRDVDTVSRMGGDEFIIVLPDTTDNGASHVAEKILETIAKPFVIQQYELNLTMSLGIALFPENGTDFYTLSRCADSALYRAKKAGRNNFQFFTEEMHARAAETMRVEHDLRRAVERDELRLHYQPQVETSTGKIVGLEALVRWQHPEWGLTSPATFIEVAEETGLIGDIGDWVMRHAITQNKCWRDAGIEIVPIAVNVSGAQFRQISLIDDIGRYLQEADLQPHYLEIELTESIAMEDSAHTIAALDKLHAMGLTLSIDDFGTGYSSLAYLKRFRVHKLKIDQSFVRDLVHDPDDESIVIAIISLAKSLGFKTIAEGVENSEQFAFLRARLCDEIQGYYLSKPLPGEDIEQLLRDPDRLIKPPHD